MNVSVTKNIEQNFFNVFINNKQVGRIYVKKYNYNAYTLYIPYSVLHPQLIEIPILHVKNKNWSGFGSYEEALNCIINDYKGKQV